MQDPQNYEKPFQLSSHILWSAINQALENTEGLLQSQVYFSSRRKCLLLLKFTARVLGLFILSWNPIDYEHSEHQ